LLSGTTDRGQEQNRHDNDYENIDRAHLCKINILYSIDLIQMLGTPSHSDIYSSAAQSYASKGRLSQSQQAPVDLLLAPSNQSARVLARPNYLADLTPRTDPFSNTGAIRGSFPRDLGKTAVHPDAFTQYGETLIEEPPQPKQVVPRSLYSSEPPKFVNAATEFFHSEPVKKDKNLISSSSNKTSIVEMHSSNSMTAPQRLALEPIDAPFEQSPLQSTNFSKLGDLDYASAYSQKKQAPSGNRPDLSFADPKQLLPKMDMAHSNMRDPTNPENYIYDRTLFAPLKRRNGTATDYIRGDLYIAPQNYGWFNVAANPGTDLNPGFFNLNYPSFEQTVQLQDTEVARTHPSLTMAQAEQVKFNNPYGGQAFQRSP
jgi:Family of unknown function (DUF5850)